MNAAMSQFQKVYSATKVTFSIIKVLLRLYQVAGSVMSMVGLWGSEYKLNNVSKWKSQDRTNWRSKELVPEGLE